MRRSQRVLLESYITTVVEANFSQHMPDGFLKKVFIEPFTDAIGVAWGETRKVSSKTLTLLQVAYASLVTTFVPVLKANYKEIFDKDRKRQQKIKQQYADIYKRVDAAFDNEDVVYTAFMFNPLSFVSKKAFKAAPKATIELVKALTAGVFDEKLDKLASGGDDSEKKKLSPKDVFGESVLREDKSVSTEKLLDFISSDAVRQKILSNPDLKKMQQASRDSTKEMISELLKLSKTLDEAKTLDDIIDATGTKTPQKLQKLTPEQRKEAGPVIVSSIKSSVKDFFALQTQREIKKLKDAGVPSSSDYIVMLEKVKSKFLAMK